MSDCIKLPAFVEEVIDRLEEAGFEAYAVGGCVRNPLMELEVSDYDITTSALPEETKAVFSDMKVIETGIKHGTVTVISNGKTAEITTYRTDGIYTDRRHPESVTFTRSLDKDLARRDFTVNAMAYSHRRGMVDLYGGTDDLSRGILRCVGKAEKRFDEDALRIMRGLRFMSVYGFIPDDETNSAFHSKKNLLREISPERINYELCKLLCGKAENLSEILSEYWDVFSVIIPEIEQCHGFDQHIHYHDRDVWEHTVASVCSIEPLVHLRLAMLFHDLGKPACYNFYNNEGHFKGHAQVSVSICKRVMKELRFDGDTSKKVLSLVEWHDVPIKDDPVMIKKLLGKFGSDAFFDLLKVHIADDMAKSRSSQDRIGIYRASGNIAKKIISEGQCFTIDKLALKGEDIMAMGFRGREIGSALDFLLKMVIEGKCENNSEELRKCLHIKKNKSEIIERA